MVRYFDAKIAASKDKLRRIDIVKRQTHEEVDSIYQRAVKHIFDG